MCPIFPPTVSAHLQQWSFMPQRLLGKRQFPTCSFLLTFTAVKNSHRMVTVSQICTDEQRPVGGKISVSRLFYLYRWLSSSGMICKNIQPQQKTCGTVLRQEKIRANQAEQRRSIWVEFLCHFSAFQFLRSGLHTFQPKKIITSMVKQ